MSAAGRTPLASTGRGERAAAPDLSGKTVADGQLDPTQYKDRGIALHVRGCSCPGRAGWSAR
ncbi:hypothetical protein OHS71_39090 [Streptomyces sp. NBC_00377]|uniref:hypothetical protein n=1 Tax=unclassified Streptomyces TaxID=2593676 RepID=UPI002E229223|nr:MULTISPECIES: hypothetical protein [unclassified Streptomyces]